MRMLCVLLIIPLLLAAVPAAAQDAQPATIGVLYATHIDTLSLQTSYRLWADGDWAAYADVFWAPAAENLGGGVSVATPLRVPCVDRLGVGLHYDGSWQGTVYVVRTLFTY